MNDPNRTLLERRLFMALAIISAFMVLLITSALTFWTMLVYR
jgi:p-aminobenzoyl-glutamate transporter AbgT